MLTQSRFTAVDTVIRQTCGYSYIDQQFSMGTMEAKCESNGSWTLINMNCTLSPNFEYVEIHRVWIFAIVGYSMSILAMMPAVFMFIYFRSLHCTRNFIHTNLMISFILRAVSFIILYYVESRSYTSTQMGNYVTTHSADALDINNASTSWLGVSRIAELILKLTTMSNHFWLMNEGIYLYNILVSSVLKYSKDG